MDLDNAQFKSQSIQFLLAAIFGPLGLLYSNKPVAILFSICFIPAIGAFGFGLFFGWPFSILAGFICVSEYNKKVKPAIELNKRKLLSKQRVSS